LNAFPDFGRNIEGEYGQNSFERPMFGLYVEMVNNNLIPIDAIYNWWGADGPQVVGPVNTIPTRETDPIPGYEKRSIALDIIPTEFRASNYPNPFNAKTRINFSLPEASRVSIEVYDINGRLVKQLVDLDFNTGEHSVNWDGDSDSGEKVSSGVYFYSIKTSQSSITRKMILLK
jgi:hypothetical protein